MIPATKTRLRGGRVGHLAAISERNGVILGAFPRRLQHRHCAARKAPVRIEAKATHMNLFQRPAYHSDITLFLNKLKAARPELAQQQEEGRNLLWDKQVDREAWDEFRAGEVAQQPYVYQAAPK